MKNEEIRGFSGCELRVIDGETPKIVGYAAVFNSLSQDLGGFREQITPGAFAGAIADGKEVLAMLHHDPKMTIGRRSRGTLTLKEDEKGLHVEIVPPNNTLGKDAIESVRRGDISGMSFRFSGAKDEWGRDNAGRVRTIKSFANVPEVTLTPIPAYEATSAELRDKLAALDHAEKATPLRDAAERSLRLTK
jgi:HK97 family phage prohead protease